MKAAVVLNQDAGTLSANQNTLTPDNVAALFQGAGIQASIHLVPGTAVVDTVRAAVLTRPDAIFVGGGDGTISSVAGLLAEAAIPLGVLPLGTLNHFAKDLKIPTDWTTAVQALAHQRRLAVDLAEVNGRVFINNCSLGAYPEAVRRREAVRRTHGHGKWRAMLIASWHVVRNLKRLRVGITANGLQRSIRAPFLLIANNRYSGNIFTRSLRPQLNGGRLWLYTTRRHRILPLLRLAWQSLAHQLDDADGLETWSAEQLILSLPTSPVLVAVDGEITRFETPLRLRILPQALHVLVPPDSAS